MEIKSVALEPYEMSVLPSIIFEVEISYRKYREAIVGISGWIETDDGKIVTNINEFSDELKTSELAAEDSIFDSNFREDIYKTRLLAHLNKQALDHVEDRRMANTKGDVNLTLYLQVKYIENRAVISGIHLVDPREMGLKAIKVKTSRGEADGNLVVYAYDIEFSASKTNMWVISGNSNPIFLAVKNQLLKKDVRVPSADWIHDYSPKLGMGEYFIVEIPKGKGVIEKAWNYVEKAEESFRKWDTKGVYANCREVGYLLDNVIKDKFGASPTIKKWKRAIEKFNYLASLNLHVEDIKKEKPEGEVKVGKPEAQHILIVTKALVKYAEELLEEND